MTQARVRLGRAGEQMAADRLAALGYEIVTRNFRTRVGEIDLVTRRGDTWVFVEVRARRGTRFGTPEESITPRKRRHLLAAAQTYLHEYHLDDAPWRIDVVAVELSEKGDLVRVDVIENAVGG